MDTDGVVRVGGWLFILNEPDGHAGGSGAEGVGGTDGLELLGREGPDAGGGLIAEVASGELYVAGIGNGEESASDGAIGGEDRFGGAGGFACKEECGAAECGEGAEE